MKSHVELIATEYDYGDMFTDQYLCINLEVAKEIATSLAHCESDPLDWKLNGDKWKAQKNHWKFEIAPPTIYKSLKQFKRKKAEGDG